MSKEESFGKRLTNNLLDIYLDSSKDWLAIVSGRKFYAGCRCECCSAKKRPAAGTKCKCGVH